MRGMRWGRVMGSGGKERKGKWTKGEGCVV